MHRFFAVVLFLIAFSPSGTAQIGKFNISGDWQNGPPENQHPIHYQVTQQGDNLTSDDPVYGHAVGHFTSPNEIVMTWASAEWKATVNSDQIAWNNQSVWWRNGVISVVSASLDVNAGQNNGAIIPDCYPAGGAQCGTLVINGILPGGPSGSMILVNTPSLGQAGYEYQASYSGPLGSGYCLETGLPIAFNCDHWSMFDNLMFFDQGNGVHGVKVRFKNWASKYQKGTFGVRFWQWTPDKK